MNSALHRAPVGAASTGDLAIRALRACGWLAAGDHAAVETLSRAHVVSRVSSSDGRLAIVKHRAAETEAGRDLGRELFAYRLAAWKPGLASVMPQPILIDEARQILAIEFVGDPGLPWPQPFATAPLRTPGIAAELGRVMTRWHADTRGISLPPSSSPGVLGLVEDLDAATEGRSPGVARFMRFVVDDPALAAILSEARSLYRPECLIHGDIRGDNWVLDEGMKLIDWEMSGVGDPAWDVAGAIGEIVLQAIRDGADFGSGAGRWPGPVGRLVPALDYRPAGEPDAFCARLLPFVVARLLHVASEWVDAGASFAPPGDFAATGITPIIAVARGLADARDLAAKRLVPWPK